jgi:hypothetical protein
VVISLQDSGLKCYKPTHFSPLPCYIPFPSHTNLLDRFNNLVLIHSFINATFRTASTTVWLLPHRHIPLTYLTIHGTRFGLIRTSLGIPYVISCDTVLIPFNIIKTLIIFGEEYRLKSFFHSAIFSILLLFPLFLRFKYSAQKFVLRHPYRMFFP